MKYINELVKGRVDSVTALDAFEEYKLRIGKDKRNALEEAERLADLYKDIKPEKFIFTGKHLFAFPD